MPFFKRSHSSFYSGLRYGIPAVIKPGDPSPIFVNGGFEDDLKNWTTIDKHISPGGVNSQAISSIKGCPIPPDPSPNPIGSGGSISPGQTLNLFPDSDFKTEVKSGGPTGKYVQMSILGNTAVDKGGATVYGPAVVSDNPVIAEEGDRISFNWTAEGGGDAFNVFAYLIDPKQNCRNLLLLDATGNSGSATTPWTTISRVIAPGEEGIYFFVFLCGTFDFSFGQAVGAKLSVDEVKIEKAGTF